MRAIARWLFLSIMILTMPAVASAQSDDGDSNLFWDITRSVVFDPTTYAPATLAYTSMNLRLAELSAAVPQWLGRAEPSFYGERPAERYSRQLYGRERKIRQMALLHLQESIVNNAAANIFERVLAEKYPQHRKLFKVLSWMERIAFASYVSYMASANHFKQAERNRQLAIQYGYR